MKDYFQNKAREWDKNTKRVQGAKKIADAINERFTLTKEMEIMDFGTGTGLLGFQIAQLVKKVHGIDTSQTMIEMLEEKNTPELSIKTHYCDIIKNPIDKEFNGIVSSMTLHHIQDLEAFFNTIYRNIKAGGFIAIADLEEEDGTFHSNNDGVHHYGFNEKKLSQIVTNAGFIDIEFKNINNIKKNKDYGIFLMTAKKIKQ